jgi:hypothetical protein
MVFKVYVAGPHGFDSAGKLYHNQVVLPLLKSQGFHVIDPWVMTTGMTPRQMNVSAGRLPKHVSVKISRTNFSGIKESDAVLAHLDGPQVDDGTAAEIGYAHALNEFATSSKALDAMGKGRQEKKYARRYGWPVVGVRDDARHTGENSAEIVNFQVAGAVKGSGLEVYRKGGGYRNAIHYSLRDALAALMALRELKEGRSTDFHGQFSIFKRKLARTLLPNGLAKPTPRSLVLQSA